MQERRSLMSWKSICQPKRDGGLGVRDVRVVNVNLLAKWRWRLLGGGEFLWKDVIREKYDDGVGNLVDIRLLLTQDSHLCGGRL